MADKKNEQLERMKAYDALMRKRMGKAVRPMRQDGFINVINRYGTKKDVSEQYKFVPEPTVPDDTLARNYEGNGLFAKIIDTPAEEAVKHGFELEGVSDEELLDFCEEALDELDWEEVATNAIRWSRLFGGAIAVMLINDGGDLKDPVNWKKIKSIDDIRVYDRSVVTPDYSSMYTQDPGGDAFQTRGSRLGMPEYYHVHSQYGNFTVHESRCLIFQNGVLPERTTNSTYQLWGMPEYIRIHRALRDAEIAHRSAPKMLDRSVQPVYKVKDLAQLLTTEQGEDVVLKRLEVIDMARGIMNTIAVDSEGEEYDFRSFQYSGVADVIDATCNLLSAITSIPQTILFGRSPAGMNSTGESDMENYYNFVERIQKRMLKSNLRYLLSVIFQAGLATGEVDEVPKIKIKFKPLWSLSELEQADLEAKKAATDLVIAQTAQVYVDMQALDATEVRKKLADSSEFDINTILDEDDLDGDFMDVIEGEAVEVTEESVSGEEKETDPGTTGSAPASAPAATKLPQDMSAEEKAEVKQNADGDDPTYGSVGVLVINNGRVLSATRHNDFGYGLICGPGGHIEDGETPEEAAIRETEEEFGIKPTELIPLGRGPLEHDTGLRPHLFLCTQYEGEPECMDLEMRGAEFRTVEELDELAASMFQPFADGLKILNDCIETALFFGDDGGEMHDELVETISNAMNQDGGTGSGNHNHKGVPGQVGGSAKGKEALMQTFENYPRTEDMYKNVFPTPKNREESDQIVRYQFGMGAFKDKGLCPHTKEKVDLSQLSTTQAELNKSTIEFFANSEKSVEEVMSTGGKLPLVLKYGDTMVIADGNHRLSYAKASGAKEVEVEVADLKAFEKSFNKDDADPKPEAIDREDGGEGSGNRNHAGRVGKIGGSAPSGAKSITGKRIRDSIKTMSDEEKEDFAGDWLGYSGKEIRTAVRSGDLDGLIQRGLDNVDSKRIAVASGVDVPEKQAKAVSDTLSNLQGLESEHNYAFDNEGNLLEHVYGNAESAEISSFDVPHATVHNHPSMDVTFSTQDVDAFGRVRNMQSMTVYAEGTKYTMSKSADATAESIELMRSDYEMYYRNYRDRENGNDNLTQWMYFNAHKYGVAYSEEKIGRNDGGDPEYTPTTFSEKPLDFTRNQGTIKSKEINEDGGSGSGNPNHSGRPGMVGGSSGGMSQKEKAKISKRLIGQKTHDGVKIRYVSDHAFDRLGGRKLSVGRAERMLKEGKVSQGNTEETRCYDIPGSRMVIDVKRGGIVSVMWRGR